ncbi:MAG: PspA/IM30 family protein [Proteobacteria bacterium]|nr:PspA/IM30 family protein [Pseudomonadota bacterium]MBU1711341.1 PspA/IM30 family protein [Pseudomonadota bacterium]
MAIMTRFVRIWKADVHGVMDQMEDKTLILKQSLRDMEEELAKKEARLAHLAASKEKLVSDKQQIADELLKLEDDLDIAVSRDKDDIARMLIKKIKPLSGHQDALTRRITTLEQDIKRFAEKTGEQQLQYKQFHLKATEYLHACEKEEWEQTASSFFPNSASVEVNEEEIELELIRRKEKVNAGGPKK